MSFFAELKRRHIYRVAAAYAVVAWVLVQLFNNLEPMLKLPDWVGILVLVLLLGGFPVALIFAWALELNATSRNVDATTLGTASMRIPLAGQQTDGMRLSAVRPAGTSLAVLPFTNMSGDESQEYFSDGITEEITAALAKVPDLFVVARTSAFEFKGKNVNIQAIGEALGASHLLEGSIRKAGERVRITVQLIKAQGGKHLWSENYNRDLTDVFAVQEEIAQAIANALRVPLGLRQGEVLVPSRTNDFESYQQYLRSRALVRARGTGVAKAISILEALVAREPGFAPAWALLAQAYYLLPSYDPIARTASLDEARRYVQSSYDKAEVAARRSIKLDSKNVGGYVALAAIQVQRGKWLEAEEHFREASALDPTEPDALYNCVVMLTATGRFKEAMVNAEKLRMLEPFVPNYNITVAGLFLIGGQIKSAISILESIPPDAGGGYFRSITLSSAYALEGRYGEAADTLLAMPEPNVVSRKSVENAASLIRNASTELKSQKELVTLEGGLNFVYAYTGNPERMMEFPERVRVITGGGTIIFIWTPAYSIIRNTESFKAHLRAAGLVAYWRARGWPDLCRPMGADDFVCD